ncbi:uncharacterized protein LOC130993869 [Salvia miltiorrhiza]|uniref:uncharacterized protein LOC130993869 n=1 Tax=Salvia miltiorrhiza TaxID=226208 RepID=UPI0025AC78D4|nr:uncharacterized protein LOC130993869 [Salvia miltiorrhiza]
MIIHSVKFEGKIIETTVTNKANVADDWMRSIKRLLKQHQGHQIIGMSCKFIHHPILSMSNKTALLQLCFQTKCLILQLLHMDSNPLALRDFLSDSNTTFVGNDIRKNSQKLQQEYAVRVSRIVDIHYLAEKWFPVSYKGKPSMRALAYGIVGFSVRKCRDRGNIKGDWESRFLDTELIEQACVDAYTSYSIAHKLLKDG